MNRPYDYNGIVVSTSQPVVELTTTRRSVMIDSGDRDVTLYPLNGQFTVSLPRVYKNIVSITVKSASFHPIIQTIDTTPGALIHKIANGSVYSEDTQVSGANYEKYFLVEVEDMNKTDECAYKAKRSASPGGYFFRVPADVNGSVKAGDNYTGIIMYNSSSNEDYVALYDPPLENLSRIKICTRFHSQSHQLVDPAFIYWTNNGKAAVTSGASQNVTGLCDYSLVLEIEYLQNSFNQFSSFETRLPNKA